VQPFLSGLTVCFCGVNVHVIEHDVAGNENSLPGNPKHRVFIGVTSDVFEDLYFGAVEVDNVGIEPADRNNLRGGTRAQELSPFFYFLLIDLVDSIYYRRIRDNSHPRICLVKDLQTEKMIGVLMRNVDKGEWLSSLFDFL